MFLLVKRLLKLGISMIDELLCLSKSIPSNFVLPAFVSSCRLAKFYSVVLHGSWVSNIVSLKCFSYNLNPPRWNKLMVSHFNLLTSFILLSQSSDIHTYKQTSTYISSLTF